MVERKSGSDGVTLSPAISVASLTGRPKLEQKTPSTFSSDPATPPRALPLHACFGVTIPFGAKTRTRCGPERSPVGPALIERGLKAAGRRMREAISSALAPSRVAP